MKRNGKYNAAEGERLKAETLALLEARRERYVRRARRMLLSKMLTGDGTATADDIRYAIELPDTIDPRCLGSVPGPLARAGLIRRARFAKSARTERHASYISVWALVDRQGAERWLQEHPDLLDSTTASIPMHPGNGVGERVNGKQEGFLFSI